MPICERIRVRGTVQGVGFRPFVWRIANELGIRGSVINDGQGVLINAVGTAGQIDSLVRLLSEQAPPLARVEACERRPCELPDHLPSSFVIAASRPGSVLTTIAADAATCADCVSEIFELSGRRFRYALTNCSHCGPRLSFVTGTPYDRSQTTMAAWPMCADCRKEYENPADRRFHAQAIACPACGPEVRLRRLDGLPVRLDSETFRDDCDAAAMLLARGFVLAIKGLGGYQLACDATQADAVARLRFLKRRESKPFALMAADLDVVRVCCEVDEAESRALLSPAAPIVLLQRRSSTCSPAIAGGVAPGLKTLGFMLPNSGLHHLLLRRIKRPIVLTSGNLSEEPQAITLETLAERFAGTVYFVLDHDRPIARRIDDSVMAVADGQLRVLRRARGLAPEPITMPAGFEAAPPVLAYGGELKNTFCMLRHGQAVLSQHIGDLADAASQADYRRALLDMQKFHAFEPTLSACDGHPEYLSTQLAHQQAKKSPGGRDPVEVLHHHAHVAACLVDNGWPLDGGPVLAVALDGLGFGLDASGEAELWGGEFALADYRTFERRGSFKPVALLGGEAAMREPWRNTYAHLMAAMQWPAFATNYAELELHDFLASQPRDLLDAMLAKRVNSPLASSCGRLFDAVAAALGICREHAAYEGQAAVELEALVDHDVLQDEDDSLAYPFAIERPGGSGLAHVEPLAMWSALLGDMLLKTPVPTMAARFHKGLARVICRMVDQLAQAHDAVDPLRHVVLSGGVFQNRVLLERVTTLLRANGYHVMTHHRVPCNDGGLALGQAAVAAAHALQPDETSLKGA